MIVSASLTFLKRHAIKIKLVNFKLNNNFLIMFLTIIIDRYFNIRDSQSSSASETDSRPASSKSAKSCARNSHCSRSSTSSSLSAFPIQRDWAALSPATGACQNSCLRPSAARGAGWAWVGGGPWSSARRTVAERSACGRWSWPLASAGRRIGRRWRRGLIGEGCSIGSLTAFGCFARGWGGVLGSLALVAIAIINGL